MSSPLNNPGHYRATLKEMATRLQYPGAKSSIEIVQDGKVAHCLLYVLDRLDALEKVRG